MSNIPSPTFRHIPAHTLSELLTSVQHDTFPLGPTLIPALDEHLDQAHPAAACKRGDVVEVQGSAASGKSHLLYYMLINCVLPFSYSSVKLGGWGKAAILVDTDHKFNAQRFAQLLGSRARRLLPLNRPGAEAITTKALDLLHILRPSSSHQLAATIQHLPTYLATNLPEADLGILAIDSITAFYWPDRYILEQIRSGNSSRASLRSLNPLNHVYASIQSLAQSHGPLVLFSSWDLSPFSATESQRRFDTSTSTSRSDTGKPWQYQLSISCHITLAASNIPVSGKGNMEDRSTNAKSENTTTSLLGTVCTPGNSMVTQFVLHVTEDDIVVL